MTTPNATTRDLDRSKWLRVSCVALCRIEHSGRYLLLLNRNRRRKGLYVLSPIGGALLFTHPTALAAFGAVPEDPAAHELRILIPPHKLDAFREWFYRGVGRERSPWRELHEELVEESGLLNALAPHEVRIAYSHTVEQAQTTDRQGLTGWLTYYFLEIYDVTFLQPATLRALLSAPPESGALWVEEAQIRRRQTLRMVSDGAERTVQLKVQALLSTPNRQAPKPNRRGRSENSLNSEGKV